MKGKSLLALSILFLASTSAFSSELVKAKLIGHKQWTTSKTMSKLVVTDMTIDQKKIAKFLQKSKNNSSVYIHARNDLHDLQQDWQVNVENNLRGDVSVVILNGSKDWRDYTITNEQCVATDPANPFTSPQLCDHDENTYSLAPEGYIMLQQGLSSMWSFAVAADFYTTIETSVTQITGADEAEVVFDTEGDGFIHVVGNNK